MKVFDRPFFKKGAGSWDSVPSRPSQRAKFPNGVFGSFCASGVKKNGEALLNVTGGHFSVTLRVTENRPPVTLGRCFAPAAFLQRILLVNLPKLKKTLAIVEIL